MRYFGTHNGNIIDHDDHGDANAAFFYWHMKLFYIMQDKRGFTYKLTSFTYQYKVNRGVHFANHR